MTKIAFTKVVASGNDFVIIENNYPLLARQICGRKFGIGADGLLLLEKSKKADVRMRVFNADGSEAEMCGNGARATALYWARKSTKTQARKKQLTIETKAGIIEARVTKDTVKIKLTDPKEYQKKIPLVIRGRKLKANFINTGVPHTIIFVQGIEQIDVPDIGRELRYHKYFSPAGTNVNFAEMINNNTLKVRTYERGVENETLACGTGSAASAIVFSLQSQVSGQRKINVITQGKETLKVYFKKDADSISDVWLEGKAKIVCKGEFYV